MKKLSNRHIVRLFCQDVLKCLESNNNEQYPFYLRYYAGLCFNFQAWLTVKQFDFSVFSYFGTIIGNSSTPFNVNLDEYHQEANNNRIYQNPKRLAWIKKYAK